MKFSKKWLKSYHFLVCTLITLLFNVELLGFDVVFSEPDTGAGIELLEKLASGTLQKDAGFLSTLETRYACN